MSMKGFIKPIFTISSPLLFVIFCLILGGLALTGHQELYAAETGKFVVKVPELKVNLVPPKDMEIKCPYARYMWKNPEAADECFRCHSIPSMKLLEAKPDESFSYPNSDTRISGNKAYYDLVQPSASRAQEFFRYVSWHKEINHVVIEIHTTGGDPFDAWKVVGFMLEFQSKPGHIVETRVYGLAASAGVMIFVAGSPGHRFMNPHAELMLHELWTFEWYKTSTPSGTEEDSQVKRHLQDNIANFIVSRTGLTKKDLDAKVRHKEFWLTGEQAIKVGVADKLIGVK